MKLTMITLTAAAAALLSLASCGGGASTPAPGGNSNTPTPGTANLHGQLVQGRGVSAAGVALAGAEVELIDASGNLVGSDQSDSSGQFEFDGVPSGSSMLMQVSFDSGKDLDGDGTNDKVELSQPVDLADQSTTDVTQQVDLTDSDNDGAEDSVDVTTDVSDDQGHSESHASEHRHKDGVTVNDTNNDGQFDSSDDSFDDTDCDGLPDDNGGSGQGGDSGHHGDFAEVHAHGAIDAISDTSVTVAGQTFAITSATRMRVGSNENATAADFTTGMLVKVNGFTDADGNLVATKLRDMQANSGEDDEFGHHGNGSGSDDVNTGDDNGGQDATGDDNGGQDGSGDDSGGGADGNGGSGGGDDGSGGDGNGGGHGGGEDHGDG